MTRILVSVLLCFVPATLIGQCGSWQQALLHSFAGQQPVDQARLHVWEQLDEDHYLQLIRKIEQTNQPPSLQGANAEPLRVALAKFYEAGENLYGVHLDPELTIIGDESINASATGSIVRINAGIIRLFTNGQSDPKGLYFIVAHEAAHNLMRHIDRTYLSSAFGSLNQYGQIVHEQRKDLAEGKEGQQKFSRYLIHSLEAFSNQINSSKGSRDRESEADVVGLLLLARSGFDPESAIGAAQQMDTISQQPTATLGNALTTAWCSDHPDWIFRTEQLQQNLNCLRFTHNLCGQHKPLQIDEALAAYKQRLVAFDAYAIDTKTIAESDPQPNGQRYEIEIDVKPKSANVLLDQQRIAPGKVQLAAGRHTIAISQDGYVADERTFAVFPDVQRPKVQVKLKKVKN